MKTGKEGKELFEMIKIFERFLRILLITAGIPTFILGATATIGTFTQLIGIPEFFGGVIVFGTFGATILAVLSEATVQCVEAFLEPVLRISEN